MTANEFPTIIHLITDYGSDNAVSEVIPRLRKYFGFGSVEIVNTSIENFNTINNAFWVAQLGLNAELPTLIYHNVAPRKDDKDPRVDNRGEELLGIRLKNGVVVVGPNSGYSHSLLLDHIESCHEIFVGGKSQFRSRDVFIEPASLYWKNDKHLQTIPTVAQTIIPKIENNVVLHIDNYGNIKTNITAVDSPPGQVITIGIGQHKVEAIVAGGAFQQQEGVLGFVPGSSGWDNKPFYELFLRGASAYEFICNSNSLFAPINAGDSVKIEYANTTQKQ